MKISQWSLGQVTQSEVASDPIATVTNGILPIEILYLCVVCVYLYLCILVFVFVYFCICFCVLVFLYLYKIGVRWHLIQL